MAQVLMRINGNPVQQDQRHGPIPVGIRLLSFSQAPLPERHIIAYSLMILGTVVIILFLKWYKL